MATKKELNAKLRIVFKKPSRYKVLYGGRGCVHADTLIDTPSGKVRIADFNGGLIYSYNGSKIIETYACKPIKYTKERLYKISTNNNSIICTDQHRFLTSNGWVEAKNLSIGDNLPIVEQEPHESQLCLLQSNPDICLLKFHEDVRHCFQTFLGLIYHYWQDYHPYDGRPLLESDIYLDIVRTLAYGLQHNSHALTHKDDLGNENNNNLSQSLFLLSNHAVLLLRGLQNYVEKGNYIDEKTSVLLSESFRSIVRFHEKNNHHELIQALCWHTLYLDSLRSQDGNLKTILGSLSSDVDDNSYSDSFGCNINLHYITNIEYYSTDYYYDFFVPIYNNYISNGFINHNSGKSHSAAEFIIAAMASCTCRVVCCRQFLNKSGESIFQLLKTKIHAAGLQSDFDITALKITCKSTGSEAMFYGLWKNIDEIKSLEDVDICLLEEAHNLTEEQFMVLDPTFRKQGFCFVIVFNPRLVTDFPYKKFVVNTPKKCLKLKLNYYDNPYLNKEFIEDVIEPLKESDYQLYEHHFLGEPLSDDDDSIIKRSHVLVSIDAHKKLGIAPSGIKRIGYDVADSGNDWCASILVHGGHCYGLDLWKAKDDELLKSCTRVWNLALKHNASITYDAIGVGAHSGSKFNELNSQSRYKISHNKFFAGGQCQKPESIYAKTGIKNKDYFSNIKAQKWQEIADRFRNTYNAVMNGHQISESDIISIDSDLPHLEQLIDELTIVKRDFDLSGKVKVESKKDLLKRDIASPNLADAFIMAYANNSTGGLF